LIDVAPEPLVLLPFSSALLLTLLLTFLTLVAVGEDIDRLHLFLVARISTLPATPCPFPRREREERSHLIMAKRIYVGGLPYSCTEEDLSKLFASLGTVASATVITDKYTGQAKGFGFVEMSTDAEADAAISQLNGTQMGGRSLTVNEAKAREERPRGGGGYGGGRDSDRGGGNRW
jgi:hypothetical protein